MKNKKYMKLTLSSVLITSVVFASFVACTDSQAVAKPNIVTKDAPKPGVMAKIGSEEITEEELVGDAKNEFFELRKREYDLRMDRLNKLMEEKLIGAEAKKANLSVDEFINKKVVGKITISSGEYAKFIKEKGIPDEQLKQHPEYKERITQFLENQKKQEAVQKYLAKLTKSQPVEVYFKKPVMEKVVVDVGDAPIIGKKDAKVQVVAFSDFQCPYCSKGADVMHQIEKKYGSKVAVSFKHYPLPFHQQALPASEISMCVNKISGNDKFWKFHDLVFKNQDKMDTENLLKLAKDAGSDSEKVKECYDKGEFKEFVKADMDYGNKIGVRSTPTFFVNGQMVAGALPIEQFSEIIDEELSAKK